MIIILIWAALVAIYTFWTEWVLESICTSRDFSWWLLAVSIVLFNMIVPRKLQWLLPVGLLGATFYVWFV